MYDHIFSNLRTSRLVEQRSKNTAAVDETNDYWKEFVGDLWDQRLSHLREERFVYGANVEHLYGHGYGFHDDAEEDGEADTGGLSGLSSYISEAQSILSEKEFLANCESFLY